MQMKSDKEKTDKETTTPAPPAEKKKGFPWGLAIVAVALITAAITIDGCRSRAKAEAQSKAKAKAAWMYDLNNRSTYRVASNGERFKVQIRTESGWSDESYNYRSPYGTIEEAERRIDQLILEKWAVDHPPESAKWEWIPVTDNLRSRFVGPRTNVVTRYVYATAVQTNYVTNVVKAASCSCASCKPPPEPVHATTFELRIPTHYGTNLISKTPWGYYTNYCITNSWIVQ
jgi:hypothetical protein